MFLVQGFLNPTSYSIMAPEAWIKKETLLRQPQRGEKISGLSPTAPSDYDNTDLV